LFDIDFGEIGDLVDGFSVGGVVELVVGVDVGEVVLVNYIVKTMFIVEFDKTIV